MNQLIVEVLEEETIRSDDHIPGRREAEDRLEMRSIGPLQETRSYGVIRWDLILRFSDFNTNFLNHTKQSKHEIKEF
jgi:hypothetical protein